LGKGVPSFKKWGTSGTILCSKNRERAELMRKTAKMPKIPLLILLIRDIQGLQLALSQTSSPTFQ
jgi:hypothetical protein